MAVVAMQNNPEMQALLRAEGFSLYRAGPRFVNPGAKPFLDSFMQTFKMRLIAGALSLAMLPAMAADYFVVVPLKGRQGQAAENDNIAVALASVTLPSATLGQEYAGFDLKNALSVTGDPSFNQAGVSWSIVSGALPAGMSMAGGVISGTPTASDSSSFQVRAAYKSKTGEQTYQVLVGSIDVGLQASLLPQAQVGQAYSFDLKPLLSVTGDAGYAGGGAGVSWSMVSNGLPAGLSLRSDGTIAGVPTAAGSGTLVARATYKGANGEQSYQVVSISIGVALASAALPEAQVGTAYSYDLKQHLSVSGDASYSGSGVTWSVVSSSLPAGLSLRSDGTIAGTPTAAASGTLVARAAYKGVNGEQTYQLVSINLVVTLQGATLPQAVVGTAYSYDLKQHLSVAGDAAYAGSGVSWTVVSGALPAGLSLRTDGTISGTPTATGSGTLTARATYKGVNGEQAYEVVSIQVAVALATATLPDALVGQAYSFDLKTKLSVTGDAAYTGTGVTWSVVSSTLPAGITLRSDGTIAGTATAAGNGSVVARATYKGINGEQTYQLVSGGAGLRHAVPGHRGPGVQLRCQAPADGLWGLGLQRLQRDLVGRRRHAAGWPDAQRVHRCGLRDPDGCSLRIGDPQGNVPRRQRHPGLPVRLAQHRGEPGHGHFARRFAEHGLQLRLQAQRGRDGGLQLCG